MLPLLYSKGKVYLESNRTSAMEQKSTIIGVWLGSKYVPGEAE